MKITTQMDIHHNRILTVVVSIVGSVVAGTIIATVTNSVLLLPVIVCNRCMFSVTARILPATSRTRATTPLSQTSTSASRSVLRNFAGNKQHDYKGQRLPVLGIPFIPRGGDTNDTSYDHEGGGTNYKHFSPSILRIRLMDGTIQKVLIQEWETTTLRDIVRPFLIENIDYNVTLPDKTTRTIYPTQGDDATLPNPLLDESLTALALKHGSLISISPRKGATTSIASRKDPSSQSMKSKKRFDPYPDIAKDYEAAIRNAKIRRYSKSNSGMSYSSLAAIQSSLHQVEPQSVGSIHRMYMCSNAAARFQRDSCAYVADNYDDSTPRRRIALLLGTISTERRDLNQPKKARTSLSSTVESDQFCQVARVHAVWEPPYQHQKPNDNSSIMSKKLNSLASSDVDCILQHLSSESSNVIRVARYLGVQPIGWIFSYSNDRGGDDGLPVWGDEIDIGARFQIEYMKLKQQHQQPENNSQLDVGPSQFGTLAMDARTGATEAFQLSDVAVQMVSEDMFLTSFVSDTTDLLSTSSTKRMQQMKYSYDTGRYIHTRHPILVDAKETYQLDSVLCLVNIALLSHNGMFTGSSIHDSIKVRENGKISNKIRKAILRAINDDANPSKLFEMISDFHLLLALDNLLKEQDSARLCKSLYKWARGQKKSAALDEDLILNLKRALDATM